MEVLTTLATLLSLCLTTMAKDIRIAGSDTLGAKMIPQLAEAYRVNHPHLNFQIAPEGSSIAFICLGQGSHELGMSSRPVKKKEVNKLSQNGLILSEHVICYDVLAVIVHEDNPLKNLTRKQVEQIFTGDITEWSLLTDGKLTGSISVFTRNTSSGTYKTFQKLVMSKRPYGKRSQKMAGGEQPSSEVAKDLNGICYVGLAYTTKPGIKPLSIDGIPPKYGAAPHYALSRPLYIYTTQKTSQAALDFLEWTKTSPAAAKIIQKVGFQPVPQ